MTEYFVRRLVGALAVALVGLIFAQCAHANAPTIVYTPGGGRFVAGAITNPGPSDFTRLIGPGSTLGDVDVTDGRAAKVGGGSAAMSLKRTVPWGNLGRAVAKAIPLAGTAVAVYEIAEAIRCRGDGAGLECDEGTDPTVSTSTVWHPVYNGSSLLSTTGYRATQAEAWAAGLSWYETAGGCTSAFTCTMVVCPTGPAAHPMTGTGCGVVKKTHNASGSTSYSAAFELGSSVSPPISSCADLGGESVSLSIDGKCATGVYTPSSVEATGAKVEAHGDKSKAVALATGAMTRGVDLQPHVGAPQPGTLTGPGTVPGPSGTVTTTPGGGGSPATTTINTDYDVTYVNNTWNYTTITTTTHPDGSETVEEQEPAPEEVSHCEENPGTVGCMEVGDPPTNEPTWQNREVLFVPEDLGFAGECPAPVSWSVFGLSLNWEYTAICDVAPMIRVALLLMASIAAVSIVIKETA